jgi:hypothetical protein
MLKRALLTLALSLVLGTFALVLIPYAGRLAEPLLCAGTLEPETRHQGLRYRCIEAADGRITTVASDRVLALTIPILATLLLAPIYAALVANERRAAAARGVMRDDLEVAVRARAEILRVGHQGSLRRQALFRVAELHLVLWVQPPTGRPYEAQVSWLVEDESLGRLSVGAVLPVRINPRRPEHVYPDQSWAHYAWWS